MRSKPKTVTTWLVASLGSLVGLFELAKFGMSWLPSGDRDPGWLLRWLTFAGSGLFGLVFLIGSITAPRRPRRAGVIFLVFLPITAFCLAYEESGFLVWHADGSGWFEAPLPMTAIGLTVLFFVPFAAPLLILRNRKWAAIMFVTAALVAVPLFALSRWTSVLLPHLAAYATPFVLFGLFWLGTYKLGWPPLLQPRPRGVPRRIATLLVTCLLILCLDIALTLGLSALNSSLFTGDCARKTPITHPESPSHAVFTLRTIFVGRSIEALTRGQGIHGLEVGDWAIGVVRERFWGVPSRWPHLMLMTNYIYWKDETYFIDGVRENGLLTRALPIVDARVGCSRSRPIQDALVDLRMLREAPPEGGTRLIGYVRKLEATTGVFQRPTAPVLVVGARINVTGTEGTKTIMTDEMGIYQLDGLPPGDYRLELAVPNNQVAGFSDREGAGIIVHLNDGGFVEHDFDLFRNGRIAGQVKRDSENSAKP